MASSVRYVGGEAIKQGTIGDIRKACTLLPTTCAVSLRNIMSKLPDKRVDLVFKSRLPRAYNCFSSELGSSFLSKSPVLASLLQCF